MLCNLYTSQYSLCLLCDNTSTIHGDISHECCTYVYRVVVITTRRYPIKIQQLRDKFRL